MAFNVSGVAASTETYSCVIGGKFVMASGNWSVRDQKCAYFPRVQLAHKLPDLRIHDGLTDEGQSAVFRIHTFG